MEILKTLKLIDRKRENLQNISNESGLEGDVHVELVVENKVFKGRPLHQCVKDIEYVKVVAADSQESGEVVMLQLLQLVEIAKLRSRPANPPQLLELHELRLGRSN